MQRINKKHFTLLELLVVLLILGMGASLTAIKIKDAYAEQRYLTEVQQIAEHLQMAQDMMLMMQTDVRMKLFRDSERMIRYSLIVEKLVPENLAKVLEKEYILKSIRRIDFNDQSTQEDKGIILKFFSRGMAISQGKLILSKVEDSQQSRQTGDSDYQISLLGYPHFIETCKCQSSSLNRDSLQNLPKKGLYPSQLLDEMYEKIK